MNAPMIVQNQSIDFSDPGMVKTLKETVAQGATDSEFAMFVQFCRSTGLNPFKKEIWFIKTKGYTKRDGTQVPGRVQMMTGINGFHSIANTHAQYDGIEIGLVGPEGEYLPQTYTKDDYKGAWAKVYRKDRRIPIEAVAMRSEYDKGADSSFDSVWKKMPRVMITKCAESVALRKAFPQELGGLYTAEEMPTEYTQPEPHNVTPEAPKTIPVKTADQVAREPVVKRYFSLAKCPDEAKTEMHEWLLAQGCTEDPDRGVYVCNKRFSPARELKLKRLEVHPMDDKNMTDVPFAEDEIPNFEQPGA